MTEISKLKCCTLKAFRHFYFPPKHRSISQPELFQTGRNSQYFSVIIKNTKPDKDTGHDTISSRENIYTPVPFVGAF